MKTLFTVPKKELLSSKYSHKVSTPQYLPKDVKPNLWELYDKTKYNELVKNIALSNIPEDVKEFLMFAATRHIVFNYSKIADYYAHSDKDVQKLMEDSALVIIDFNDAILNGYVELSKEIDEIVRKGGIDA